MKICVSVGIYDAFEDANISSEIIKNNWPKNSELFLIAGLTKKDTKQHLSKNFSKSIYINTPKTHFYKKNKENVVIQRSLRVFESIIKTGIEAIKHDCDYIVYLSAGSWILEPKKLIKIISKMKNKTFGVRIANRSKYLLVDDHFLIVNLKNAKINGIYNLSLNGREFNPLSLTLNEIHGVLYMWLNKSPINHVLVYSDFSYAINHLGQKPHTFNPLIFDPNYLLLHSNKSFLEVECLRKIYIDRFVKIKVL